MLAAKGNTFARVIIARHYTERRASHKAKMPAHNLDTNFLHNTYTKVSQWTSSLLPTIIGTV